MIFERLKSKKGETISETLVASLIAAMSMIIFASMAIASKNIITESKAIIEQYHIDKSAINEKDESFNNGDANIEFNEALINTDNEYSVPLYSNVDDSEDKKMVIYSY